MSRRIGVSLLVTLQLACATAGRSVDDPSGVYRFEAWNGDAVFRGQLRIRPLGASWTGSIEFEGSPPIEAVRVDYDGTNLVFVAEGAAHLVRVLATVRGSGMTGTWSSGGSSGTFRAERGVFEAAYHRWLESRVA